MIHANKFFTFASGAAVLVVVVGVTLFYIHRPHRSVEAYCQVYHQEKARLDKVPGRTYPSAVFDATANDASEFATSFGHLEKVAPKDILPDVQTLGTIYQTIHDHPEQAATASMSGAQADDELRGWTVDNCL